MAATNTTQPARSLVENMICKPGEWKATPYPDFPLFLQNVAWSSRQFYAAVGGDYRKRNAPPFATEVPTGPAQAFNAVAQRYAEASDSLWGAKNSTFRTEAFHARTFAALQQTYLPAREYADRLNRLATARRPHASEEAGDLSDASVQPEIILLTTALNLALIRGNDTSLDQAMATIGHGKYDVEAIYRQLSAPNGCIGCSTNASTFFNWLPDSLKTYAGADIWRVLLLRHARRSIRSAEDVRSYAVLYRQYIGDYDVGRLYPEYALDKTRKGYPFLYDYYGRREADWVISGGICNQFSAPLLWDRDLLKVAEKYHVRLPAK